jgi:hypothetical protein
VVDVGLVVGDVLGDVEGDVDVDGDVLGVELGVPVGDDADVVGGGVDPPLGPVSDRSSAWYVPGPYQPGGHTVTDVTEAPVVNDAVSCE